jgi:hypothetical protein
MSAYTWSRAQEALSQVVGLDPDPFDDTLLEYQNPSDRRSRAADNRHRNPDATARRKCKPHRRTIHSGGIGTPWRDFVPYFWSDMALNPATGSIK